MKTETDPRILRQCPKCGKGHLFKGENLGKKSKCKGCETIFVIDSYGTPAPMIAVAPAPTPMIAVAPEILPTTPDPIRAKRGKRSGSKIWHSLPFYLTAGLLLFVSLALFVFGFQGPTDIQLLGFWSMAVSCGVGFIVTLGIAEILRTR